MTDSPEDHDELDNVSPQPVLEDLKGCTVGQLEAALDTLDDDERREWTTQMSTRTW